MAITTYHVKSAHLDADVMVQTSFYNDGVSLAVILHTDEGPEVVSVNLVQYGIKTPLPDTFYVKNYSEHEGMAEALVVAGIAERMEGTPPVTFGPYGSTATLLRLIASTNGR